jgi:leucyl-tRNA synthetase
LAKNKEVISNWAEVADYVAISKQKDEQDRLDATKEKTGVKLEGVSAINPANGEEIPVYVADYVLGSYGTGAIMAVPAHDERDFAFAKKFGIKYQVVLVGVVSESEASDFAKSGDTNNIPEIYNKDFSIEEYRLSLQDGIQKQYEDELHDGEYRKNIYWHLLDNYELKNSSEFNGMESEEAKLAIVKKVGGKMTNTYRLRDWSIGRQRYWGVPIPIVYDPEGKAHPIPEEHLPWTLPNDVDFKPTGVAPLAKSEELKKRTEEIFGQGWTPEVETMDTFVDSSWYFLRYLDNKNATSLSSLSAQKDWMPVDIYFGGAEHTTMHLLYSRFWQKVLFDFGLVTETEPYQRRVNRGLILGPDGNKMSKSKGNVIDPDEQVKRVGSDTVKMYLAFMGPYEGTNYPFDLGGIAGVYRFLERVNGLSEHISATEITKTTKLLHKTIKKIGDDIAEFKFNTAISAMMIFVNHVEKAGITKCDFEFFLRILAPFAPHLSSELWNGLGHKNSIHLESFPVADNDLMIDDAVTIGVQINGKLRGNITLSPTATQDEAKKAAEADEPLKQRLSEAVIVKIVYVPGRILNIVTNQQ